MQTSSADGSSLLNSLTIASPCSANWDEMAGDDRQRFCRQCSLHVYNLSGMASDEALKFLRGREGRTCIRLYKRTDGTVITRDCPVGLRTIRQRLVRLAAGTVAILLAIVFGGLAGRAFASSEIREHPRVVAILEWLGLREPEPELLMGDICIPTPPTTSPPVLMPQGE